MRTVGEVAALTGVTVRALHHYDELGLLSPSGRSEAGYRLYAPGDLERLHEIVVWRALGFRLAEIQSLLDDPGHDRRRALAAQRAMITEEVGRLGAVAVAIDRALAAHARGAEMDAGELFGGFDPSAYEEEVRERWGDTDAHRESRRRTAGYGEREWLEIREESDRIEAGLAGLMEAGAPASGAAARELAETHRRHIDRWFYPCSPQMHRGLGEMYVADPRFTAHYDERATGLAAYVREAIAANAEKPSAG